MKKLQRECETKLKIKVTWKEMSKALGKMMGPSKSNIPQ